MAKVYYEQEFDNGKRVGGYIPTDLNGAKALKGLFASKVIFYKEVSSLSKDKNFIGKPAKASIQLRSTTKSESVFLNILIDDTKIGGDDIRAKLKNITVDSVKFDFIPQPRISGGE